MTKIRALDRKQIKRVIEGDKRKDVVSYGVAVLLQDGSNIVEFKQLAGTLTKQQKKLMYPRFHPRSRIFCGVTHYFVKYFRDVLPDVILVLNLKKLRKGSLQQIRPEHFFVGVFHRQEGGIVLLQQFGGGDAGRAATIPDE